MRGALEAHYGKMITHAVRLARVIEAGEPVSDEMARERMHRALKQHLARSPLWNWLNQWNHGHSRLEEAREHLAQRIESKVDNDRTRVINQAARQGMIEAARFQAEEWAKGHEGINLEDHFITRDEGEGIFSVEYGKFYLGRMTEREAEEITPVVRRIEGSLKRLGEYKELSDTYQELEMLKTRIADELGIIEEKEVLPGVCQYCPA